MTGSAQVTALEAFLLSHPSIGYIPPTSPEYVLTASRGWIAGINARPLAIVQPQSAADVAAVVKFTKSNAVPFTVRSGGHNLEGHSIVDGALLINLRALTTVTIAQDHQSATVQEDILQEGEAGHSDRFYPYHQICQLGHILGATVVDTNKKIIITDEFLLHGIRGAGGIFGIIVDVTIKVYPLTKFLAGAIIFDSTDIAQIIITFNAAYEDFLSTEGLPPLVTLQQAALNSPHGRKISSLAPLLISTVDPTTIPDWFTSNGALVPEAVYGSLQTHNVRCITPAVAEVIGRNVALMPSDPGTMLSIHQLRGQSAGEDVSKLEHSVFATREPHYMLEILGCATDVQNAGTSEEWAVQTAKEVAQVDEGNVLSTAYVSLMRLASMKPDEAVKKAFGTNADVVRELKERVDPQNVFALALPALK
ncbi:FAD-binding oxidoreductase [Aspergillus vadensis CBS 113365]|uniref:FAD-binding domain-containing protein n=1 Tax=Aspergillus vadensis (strain CBS 113365 / IMI 142717 / IBT 24658) TaxID=1448311 RepID=A0A319C1I2_ASPVC|nr:FAD-binding domain-containing protein [Aspergillus vadensis CBS 113365]PYH72073.1 FAD-binding domain-containing protein [Aspergillus vadensis CBS 113365]